MFLDASSNSQELFALYQIVAILEDLGVESLRCQDRFT